MDRDEVIELMKSSKSEAEWDENCDLVKSVCGGYPFFWFEAVMLSGLFDRVRKAWSKAGR